MNAVTNFNSTGLDVLRRGICKTLNTQEFDEFIAACQHMGLDPFRKQIIPMVFSANKPDKRKLEYIVTREGLRVIASRCKNYRPKSKPAEFILDPSLKSPTNPHGIVSCFVELNWQDDQGVWHPVIGEAYWDEYAPTTEEWAWDEQKGKRAPTGKKELSGKWKQMPRLMLEKVAEVAALRSGWPEVFNAVYSEEEVEKSWNDDMTASEAADQAETERKQKAINHVNTVPFDFGDGIEMVPTGQFHDQVVSRLFRERADNPQIIATIWERNTASLREFWSRDQNAALDLKKQFEAIKNSIPADTGEAA